MIIHVCDDCGRKWPTDDRRFDGGNAVSLPRDWITIVIQDLKRIVCCWDCAENLSRRMIVNQEHPGDGLPRIPPARIGPAVDRDEAPDPAAAEVIAS